jgi:hypothetical protein
MRLHSKKASQGDPAPGGRFQARGRGRPSSPTRIMILLANGSTATLRRLFSAADNCPNGGKPLIGRSLAVFLHFRKRPPCRIAKLVGDCQALP